MRRAAVRPPLCHGCLRIRISRPLMRVSQSLAVSSGVAALTLLALLALLAAGGAAARPGGLWLGFPTLPAALLALLAPCVLLCARRSRQALARCAGLAAPAVLLVAGLSFAGLRAVSGPVLLALAGAAVALAVASLSWRTPRILLLPLVFLVFVCAGSRSSVRVGPQGDEPHYLMVADSLLRDHDVSLERDYAEGRYAGFHDGPLAPHYRVRGLQRAIYSLHAVGLSVLILPAWAWAGYPGVTVFMALLGALLVCELRAWVVDLTGRDGVAEAAAWALALSPPLLHYAGLVFSEVPAALALTYGLRRGCSARLGPAGALAVGAAAAALPWLNVRYAPLALLIVVHAVWRQRRAAQVAAAVAPALASAIGIGLYHHALYGFWDPVASTGRVRSSLWRPWPRACPACSWTRSSVCWSMRPYWSSRSRASLCCCVATASSVSQPCSRSQRWC